MTSDSGNHPLPAPNGIDRLLADAALVDELRSARTGLLTHDACRTVDGTPTRRAFAAALTRPGGSGLARLFTPEHGLAATAPAGSAVADDSDPETGAPVISLYGPRLVPDAAMLADLDHVVVDLRDVGVRCFTYAATAARLIATAAALPGGPAIIVCGRPNPLGSATDGPSLDPRLQSLVAWFAVPFVHGRTIGELLALAAAESGLTRFRIVPHFSASRAPDVAWIPPSPALDHPDAVQFYPGLVLLEGTNLCEGRGTAAPFRSVAAPWLDPTVLAGDIAGWSMPVAVAETTLAPRNGRYAGVALPALTFALSGSGTFDGFGFGVRLIAAIARRHPEFAWTKAPDSALSAAGGGARFLIDALLGHSGLREGLAGGADAETLLAGWRAA